MLTKDQLFGTLWYESGSECSGMVLLLLCIYIDKLLQAAELAVLQEKEEMACDERIMPEVARNWMCITRNFLHLMLMRRSAVGGEVIRTSY